MGIRFILMVNKQGQTRLAQYYEWLTLEERRALEGEIVRKCLARTEQQVFSLSLITFDLVAYFLYNSINNAQIFFSSDLNEACTSQTSSACDQPQSVKYNTQFCGTAAKAMIAWLKITAYHRRKGQ